MGVEAASILAQVPAWQALPGYDCHHPMPCVWLAGCMVQRRSDADLCFIHVLCMPPPALPMCIPESAAGLAVAGLADTAYEGRYRA